MSENPNIVVYGAYGHTGQFVVAELRLRGWNPIISGRDTGRLKDLSEKFGGLEMRPASIDDADSLDTALTDASAVINCAGPFLDTGNDLIEAAIRNRVNYFDVAAEQMAVLTAFDKYADAAQEAEIVVMPAVAFYGGLADLLATAAVGDWTEIAKIEIFTALDSWHPTEGTRLTGERNTFRRFIFANGELEYLDEPLKQNYDFAQPFGTQEMIEVPLTETITISRHLPVKEVRHYLNLKSLNDLRNPATPPPQLDESGRSPQIFLMEAVARQGTKERRTTASGRDIYHITAPLVVEAVERIFKSPNKIIGVVSVAEFLDARDFLESLSPEHLAIEFDES
jgi:Saccharopine dehydrogenase NADP binding domain